MIGMLNHAPDVDAAQGFEPVSMGTLAGGRDDRLLSTLTIPTGRSPMVPKRLYRGDADPRNTRKLREVNPATAYGYLLTNLSAGGDGRAIFSAPFPATINQHVAIGWDKTHFLSFTSDQAVALRFATGGQDRKLEPHAGHQWDTSLIVLDTDKLNAQEAEAGIYLCQYQSNINATTQSSTLSIVESIFRSLGKAQDGQHSALLVDVATYLRAMRPAMSEAISNAMRDKEWLILPTDRPSGLNGELAAKLDDGCVVEFQRFKYAIG